MAAESLPVPLDNNALYVSTIPLTNGFHYALIHVDRNGTATRHHWAAMTIDPHGPEGYVAQPMPRGPRMKAGQQQILAYFRVLEYRSTEVSAFQDVCASVFPKTSSSALQNRAANMNSRTWITRVLARVLGSPERAMEIEQYVSAHSRVYSDGHACAFLFGRPYTTLVVPVASCNSPQCSACRTCSSSH
ncbi:hypothetical protein L227DRAFT_657846 [Lentinus tigrinus ALCF2SS1-6]|uniref:Uncharacterized protein n=1 Tax=Lentinus tigrinus ALCF2SS1-6 TaxID=1328759 RepID=A0A5C2RR63_9APHY|nr:hypothetical protein L227DRAFT_657846 [Lentinus tigrinus ALCF2SS1-6]